MGAKWFICPKQNFIWKKLLISFSSTYWTVSFSKILKKLLKLIQIYEDVPLSDPKYSNLSWTKFFGTNHYYYFHLPIGPFHWAKFKKNSYSRSRAMRIHHFWPKMVHLPPPKKFFGKIINIALIYLLPPFIVQNFNEILPPDPELWGCAIFGPKMAHFPKW